MKMAITVAARSKAWTVFAHSNAGIVVSNLTWGIDVCVRLFCVYAVLCVRSGLATGWFPVQEVLPTVYRINKLKKRPRPSKGVYSHNNTMKICGWVWRYSSIILDLGTRRIGEPEKISFGRYWGKRDGDMKMYRVCYKVIIWLLLPAFMRIECLHGWKGIKNRGNLDYAASVMNGLRAKRPWNGGSIAGRGKEFFTTASRLALRPTHLPIQWVPGALYLGVNLPGREADL
jgi:hypothetical protein